MRRNFFAWMEANNLGVMLDLGAFAVMMFGIYGWLLALDGHHPFAMQGAIIMLMVSATIFYASGLEGYDD